MRNIIILSILLVVLIASSPTLHHIPSERGTGISADQQKLILNITTSFIEENPDDSAQIARDLKYRLEELYGQFWAVQVIESYGSFKWGRSGIRSNNDQWISFTQQVYNVWIWVPQTSKSLTFHQESEGLYQRSSFQSNQKQVQMKGKGISDGQEVAIQKIMENAALSKKDNLQQNAEFIEQKLEDSYGQNWIVEICAQADLWGRVGIAFKSDQFLFYVEAGSANWQYFIWVPGY